MVKLVIKNDTFAEHSAHKLPTAPAMGKLSDWMPQTLPDRPWKRTTSTVAATPRSCDRTIQSKDKYCIWKLGRCTFSLALLRMSDHAVACFLCEGRVFWFCSRTAPCPGQKREHSTTLV